MLDVAFGLLCRVRGLQRSVDDLGRGRGDVTHGAVEELTGVPGGFAGRESDLLAVLQVLLSDLHTEA